MHAPMSIPSALRSTVMVLSVIANCASPNPEPGVSACVPDRLPTNGARCDAAVLGKDTYCRLKNCGYGGEHECSCRNGIWICENTLRDNYGCGTPPTCRNQPCP